MATKTFTDDLRISAEAAWYFISIIVFVLLIFTFLFPEMLLKVSPACISKSLYGKECFMCGSTRAFTEITKGNFLDAFDLNKFSIILFSLFILNTIVFITCLILKPGRMLYLKDKFLNINVKIN